MKSNNLLNSSLSTYLIKIIENNVNTSSKILNHFLENNILTETKRKFSPQSLSYKLRILRERNIIKLEHRKYSVNWSGFSLFALRSFGSDRFMLNSYGIIEGKYMSWTKPIFENTTTYGHSILGELSRRFTVPLLQQQELFYIKNGEVFAPALTDIFREFVFSVYFDDIDLSEFTDEINLIILKIKREVRFALIDLFLSPELLKGRKAISKGDPDIVALWRDEERPMPEWISQNKKLWTLK